MRKRGAIVRAPFSADQVASLNAHQESEYVQPYVCALPGCAPWVPADERLPLAADADGLWCIEGMGCTYVRHWAHAPAADWSWRKQEKRAIRRQRRSGRRSLRQFRRVLRGLSV